MSEVILACILSSTLVATVITSIKELVLWYLNRRAKVSDDAREDKESDLSNKIKEQQESLDKILEILDKLEQKVDVSCKSSKVILQDRIKWIVLKHIEAGEVTFEDRKLVHEMWDIYHNGLNGNGDLDDIMAIFNELPIKIK